MRRREFIAVLGAAGAAWPLAARAQRPRVPLVGFLHLGSHAATVGIITAFRLGLNDAGYAEDRNVVIEYRFADGDVSRLPALSADLVHLGVSAIATPNSTSAALAAKAATATIPIVFSGGVDAVQVGLVASLNKPGGNVTGVNGMSDELVAKRVEFLHELIPRANRIAALVNPQNKFNGAYLSRLQAAASTFGFQLDVVSAGPDDQVDRAFAELPKRGVKGLQVIPEILFVNQAARLAELSIQYAMPTVYPFREFAKAGGLISYGPNLEDNARKVGMYTGRILSGEKPANLPVMEPTKFDLVVNLQTAKALGLEIPSTLLVSADEVIE
jgi:putative tryptophan/tyrosine transport system substrate-binding protein